MQLFFRLSENVSPSHFFVLQKKKKKKPEKIICTQIHHITVRQVVKIAFSQDTDRLPKTLSVGNASEIKGEGTG